MSFKKTPQELMQLAIEAAAKAGHEVRPNPRVGAAAETLDGNLLVAHHSKFGSAHAEAKLILQAKEAGISLQGAQMAVTLEPCSHFGKTPPCSKALIEAGVKTVFVGSEDPFPQVRGRGIAELKAAGIAVKSHVLQDECEALNEAWLFAHRRGRARFVLKMASSLDGGWASEKGLSKWITQEASRLKGHELRARVDAIVTGFATIRRDNPSLTARNSLGETLNHQPKVFVLTQRENESALDPYKVAAHPAGVELRRNISPKDFAAELYQSGLYDVMLEAGPTLSQEWIEAGLVDEIWCFVDTQFLGGGRLGWPRAFSGGDLPGSEWIIRSAEVLDERSVFLKLVPRAKSE